jgi:hypothetical protein
MLLNEFQETRRTIEAQREEMTQLRQATEALVAHAGMAIVAAR